MNKCESNCKQKMQKIILDRKLEIKSICQTLKVKRLYVFGSVVSDRFNEKSDIDFLISFADNISIEDYTNNYFLLHYQLKELFNRNIDIVTERTLSNPYFIESINNTKELIYED
jgi:predicted nucleotidyltransferase